MSDSQWPFALAALLFAAGMWMLLPNGRRSSRCVGAGLITAGLALLTLLVHFGLIVHRQSPYFEWASALASAGINCTSRSKTICDELPVS